MTQTTDSVKWRRLSVYDGWLILPAFIVVLSPLMAISGAGELAMAVDAIKERGLSGKYPNADVFETVFNAAYILLFLATLVTAILFFMRHHAAPTAVIATQIARILVCLCFMLLSSSFIGTAPNMMGSFPILLSAILMILYFRFSKRVKATFVK